MKTVQISGYQIGQEYAICQLIRKVYDEFVVPDYTDEGNCVFYEWIAPEKIAERQQKSKSLFVAKANDVIVGMIEIRDNHHISLLFVDKAFQGQGIAKNLFQASLANSLLIDPKLKSFSVHASRFSIPVYQKFGFAATNSLQKENGISYLPMALII